MLRKKKSFIPNKPSVWLVLNDVNKRSLKHKFHPKFGYKLSQGEILRFGKVRFRVKQLNKLSDDLGNIPFAEKEINEDEEPTIRHRSM